jgi:hypothetical protein
MLVIKDIIGRYELANKLSLWRDLSATEDTAEPKAWELEDFQDRLPAKLYPLPLRHFLRP